jgi:hypothetical protein
MARRGCTGQAGAIARLPTGRLSTTLEGTLDWPDATVESGDALDVVARLKEESDVPLRSHGSLSMNRALMAAGLVDRLQVTLFRSSPVRLGWTQPSLTRKGVAYARVTDALRLSRRRRGTSNPSLSARPGGPQGKRN